MKQIVIALVDRLAAHAAREADSNDDDEESEAPASPKAESVKAEGEEEEAKEGDAENETEDAKETEEGEEGEAKEDEGEAAAAEVQVAPAPKPPKVRKIRGIPEDVKLFEIFWGKIVELVKVNASYSLGCVKFLIPFYVRAFEPNIPLLTLLRYYCCE